MTGGTTTSFPSPLELFLELVQVASPSRHEAAVARRIGEYLDQLGISYRVDDSAKLTGSDTGNVIAGVERSRSLPTVLFVAHMDTVQPLGTDIVPIIGREGLVRSADDTILGADNKAAVAALLVVLSRSDLFNANVIAVFSTCEESGRMGVTGLEAVVPQADIAFPVDGSYPVGTILTSALGQVPFEIEVRGREAHASRNPDAGLNAVRVASEIVSSLRLGWQGSSVINISSIRGGGPTNIIPALARIDGEVRGFSRGEMQARIRDVRLAAETAGARSGAHISVFDQPQDGAPPFPGDGFDVPRTVAAAAAAQVGLGLQFEECRPTLEANYLHAMGIPTLGIASGGRDPHSPSESLPAAELDRLVLFLEAIISQVGLHCRRNQGAVGGEQ